MNFLDLSRKYDVQAPRYTSYPTVPFWSDSPTTQEWISSVKKIMVQSQSTWSLYIHIPFCETLCTFCGCNTSITKNHSLEVPYVDRVLSELNLYLEQVPELKEKELEVLHLGGGTPTFLSSANLEKLFLGLTKNLKLSPRFEGSLEIDPRRTSEEQLVTLKKLGFNRVSLGVQDTNPSIQKIINRHQTLDETEKITQMCKRLGFESINWDLIFGLPLQTIETISDTATALLKNKPDRVALYSFALVPWIKPQQRLFKDEDLPVGEEKRKLYEAARNILIAGGYQEIGMDHFALSSDALFKSLKTSKLHRNFMGYTDQKTDLLLGLGVSAISETPDCFHQNEKVISKYEMLIDKKEIPTLRGHKLTSSDQKHRLQILDLMTKYTTQFLDHDQFEKVKPELEVFRQDGLIEFDSKSIAIKPEGVPFVRNICMSFDERLQAVKAVTEQKNMFSKSL